MTIEEIKQTISQGKTYAEVEKIAETLTYELIPSFKKSQWRTRYNSLTRLDFRTIGKTTISLKCNVEKDIFQWLFSLGYKRHFKDGIFFKKETNEIVFVNCDFAFIDYNFTLCTLEEYIEIVSSKILALVKKQEETREYVLGLISDKKELLDQITEQSMVESIIEEAIEKAKKNGLIKERPSATNYNELNF